MRSSRKRLASSLLLVVMLAAGCSSDEPTSAGAEKERPAEQAKAPEVPVASFTVVNLKAVDPQDRPDNPRLEEQKFHAINLINELYNDAFLDPKKWANGHPGLSQYFTPEAQKSLGANLYTLALGDIADSTASVKPEKQEITRLTLYVDNDLNIPAGVATVLFDATGTPKVKGAPLVDIRQSADFWLQKDGAGYKISAYRADLSAISRPESGG